MTLKSLENPKNNGFRDESKHVISFWKNDIYNANKVEMPQVAFFLSQAFAGYFSLVCLLVVFTAMHDKPPT